MQMIILKKKTQKCSLGSWELPLNHSTFLHSEEKVEKEKEDEESEEKKRKVERKKTQFMKH